MWQSLYMSSLKQMYKHVHHLGGTRGGWLRLGGSGHYSMYTDTHSHLSDITQKQVTVSYLTRHVFYIGNFKLLSMRSGR